MSASGKRPSDFVRVPLSAERTERIWQRLEASRGRRRGWPLAVAGSAAAAVAVALLVRRPVMSLVAPVPVAPVVPIVADVATARVDGVALVDGSVLRPERDARTTVVAASAREIRVRLGQGAVDLDVARVPSRQFVLEAPGVEVLADGARLRAEVKGDPAALSLAVLAGDVEVRSPAGERLASLREGQTWSLRAPEAVASAPARRPEPHVAPRVPAPSSPVAPPAASALFAEADRARLEGHPTEAARRLEQLCLAHPSDARAGVAAFQLGRLRLRELGDPLGAATWFRAALAHPSAAAYREDAEADLVEALDRAGQTAACARARDAFVAAHATSLRRATVEARCKERP